MLMLPSGVGFAVNVMGGDGNEGGEGGGSGDDFVPASDTATATSNPVGDAGAKALDPDAPYSVGQVVDFEKALQPSLCHLACVAQVSQSTTQDK